MKAVSDQEHSLPHQGKATIRVADLAVLRLLAYFLVHPNLTRASDLQIPIWTEKQTIDRIRVQQLAYPMRLSVYAAGVEQFHRQLREQLNLGLGQAEEVMKNGERLIPLLVHLKLMDVRLAPD